ncbi:sugar/nucleoside kinase (ribokinase family) [Limimaricola variabilis]|uniref:Sugar/nucleoside kinase (Ribokinase family) n=1 Tax=Limimaricola variabilis TaxID=1492771 RepID=A0ABR6HR78_9RHOB|nr:sugar kinase [Limimaricola variabilis]MBB3713042.1 sugar/nucleoside kinase (ribokinase family) [Limimaricola variabilis]
MDAPTLCTIGELLVEFVSHKKGCGLRTIADYSGPYPSGAPAIFLDQAARMGARTRMYGGLGEDGFGQLLRDRLDRDGVGTEGVENVPGRTTGTAFVSYYDDGRRDFIFHLANTAADGFSFDAGTLPDGDLVLHVSAASLGAAPLRHAIMRGVEAVLSRGGRITCDPNARPELLRDDAAREALEYVVARSWCLMPSTSDLGFLYPDLDESAAIDRLLDSSAEIVAVKRGAGGATLVGHGERHDLPGHAVTEIDPTGAGDGFCGTLVALLLQGRPLAEAGRLANAAGAIAVTRRGPMEGNSTPAEIEAFLASSLNPEGKSA